MNFHFNPYNLIDCTLAFLVLINPISKLFIISTFTNNKTKYKQILKVCTKASIAAITILLLFTWTGHTLLKNVFHVEIYSLMIAGGIVLFYRGMKALNKGLFFETHFQSKLEDMAIVPLASPMIAGPAAIAASVSFPNKYGLITTSIAIIIGILINWAIMTNARFISKGLIKHQYMGALIRITGLIVATMGIQMILNGVIQYIKILGI